MSDTDSQVTTDDLLDVLTLGEIAQVEELSGLSITTMSDQASPKGRLLIAMACVAGRRGRPGFSINEAEALTGRGLNDIIASIVAPAGGVTPPPPVAPEVLGQTVVGGANADPEG